MQYADWIKGVVLYGDFGISVKYNKPVKEIIAQKLPNTVKLACTSFLTMILISFPLGILSAVYKDRIADYIIRFLSFIGVSMPSFWFGMLMIWIFCSQVWMASCSGFFFLEAHYYADPDSCSGNELLLYPQNPRR